MGGIASLLPCGSLPCVTKEGYGDARHFHSLQHSSEADLLSNHPCRVSTIPCSSLCVFCISRYRRDTMEHTILVRTGHAALSDRTCDCPSLTRALPRNAVGRRLKAERVGCGAPMGKQTEKRDARNQPWLSLSTACLLFLV